MNEVDWMDISSGHFGDAGSITLLIIFVVGLFLIWLHATKYKWFVMESRVVGFEGKCVPVWLNTSELDVRISRHKCYTGFFKKAIVLFGFMPITYGKDFHGRISGRNVYSTGNTEDDEY